MMTFIAHVDVYNSIENATQSDSVLFFAESFSDAAAILDEYYGTDLEKITLLEPISDNDFVFLDPVSEMAIRENEFNSFI